MGKKLVIVLGPTAVGKTDYSIELAQKFASPVISCDSRQIYKEMKIGTAVPSASQLAAAKHYFIQDHSVEQAYTAGIYEMEAMELIERLFSEGHETLVMSGGSMFYIDAVCRGLDDTPKGIPELRQELLVRLHEEGVGVLAEELKILDYETYKAIDLSNGQRLVRALEVCKGYGRPFSSYKTFTPKLRNFSIEKIGLRRSREELYQRINRRVLEMLDEGLIEEVRSLKKFRNLTALKTVGYKEVFEYLDSQERPASEVISLDRTIEAIQLNTRHYAKRQLTWWRRDSEIRWIDL